MKTLKHNFRLGFLDYDIEVIFTDSIKESLAEYEELDGKVSKHADGLHAQSKTRFRSYIFLENKCPIPVIAHEAFHAVAAVCKLFGIPLKDASEETYAYMLDFILGEILKFKEKEKI